MIRPIYPLAALAAALAPKDAPRLLSLATGRDAAEVAAATASLCERSRQERAAALAAVLRADGAASSTTPGAVLERLAHDGATRAARRRPGVDALPPVSPRTPAPASRSHGKPWHAR